MSWCSGMSYHGERYDKHHSKVTIDQDHMFLTVLSLSHNIQEIVKQWTNIQVGNLLLLSSHFWNHYPDFLFSNGITVCVYVCVCVVHLILLPQTFPGFKFCLFDLFISKHLRIKVGRTKFFTVCLAGDSLQTWQPSTNPVAVYKSGRCLQTHDSMSVNK